MRGVVAVSALAIVLGLATAGMIVMILVCWGAQIVYASFFAAAAGGAAILIRWLLHRAGVIPRDTAEGAAPGSVPYVSI